MVKTNYKLEIESSWVSRDPKLSISLGNTWNAQRISALFGLHDRVAGLYTIEVILRLKSALFSSKIRAIEGSGWLILAVDWSAYSLNLRWDCFQHWSESSGRSRWWYLTEVWNLALGQTGIHDTCHGMIRIGETSWHSFRTRQARIHEVDRPNPNEIKTLLVLSDTDF